jgi:hypothetical protein
MTKTRLIQIEQLDMIGSDEVTVARQVRCNTIKGSEILTQETEVRIRIMEFVII